LVDKFNEIRTNISEYDTELKTKYFDGVMVDVNPYFSRVFYEAEFDEKSPVGPACFSDNNIAPSVNADRPQSATCRACHWLTWGSNKKGSRAKACKEHKKVAFMVPGFDLETAWLLRVPPTSKVGLGGFTRQLDKTRIGDRTALPTDVMCRVYFVDGENFKLDFRVLRSLHELPEDAAIYDAAVALFESGATADIIGLNDKPIEGLALPSPQQQPMQRLPAPAITRAQPAPRPAPKDDGIIDVEGIDVTNLPPRGRR